MRLVLLAATLVAYPALAQEQPLAEPPEHPPSAEQADTSVSPSTSATAVATKGGRADDNAVTAAEDAFGSTVGRESIGIYSSFQVRGFSPSIASNLRIEGLYFDNQTFMSARLVSGSTIRVGFSALGYPFPAPTGIVDYRLRKAGDDRVVSVVAGLADYAAPFAEVDALVPLTDRLGVAAGVSYGHEEYFDGADARFLRLAVAPRWRPTEAVEIIPFWSLTQGRDEETAPTLVTTGSFAPPEVRRRRYFGPDWAVKDSESGNAGLIAKVRFGDNWSLSAGAFRSFSSSEGGFADIFLIDPDGRATERVIADPSQRRRAWSGELRLSRSFVEGDRLHIIHASARGRTRTNRYGGSAPTIVGIPGELGAKSLLPEPDTFAFREQSRDRLNQWTAGLAYEGRWRDVGELILGVQRTRFEKQVELPSAPPSAIEDSLLLYNAALAITPTNRLSLYAGYTRGLEESGIAPDNAANRLEVLPPIRTTQADAGVRYAFSDKLRLTAGLFDVRKPYFSNDAVNRFIELGEVRHRGVELSLSGSPIDGLTVVSGAVLMSPRVTGEEVEAGRIGERPVGQTGTIVRANVDYTLPFAPALSLNAGVSHYGDRVASRDNSLVLPSYTLVDLGARYRFPIGDKPASIRLALSNLTDEYFFDVYGANSFGITDGRRVAAYLSVDF